MSLDHFFQRQEVIEDLYRELCDLLRNSKIHEQSEEERDFSLFDFAAGPPDSDGSSDNARVMKYRKMIEALDPDQRREWRELLLRELESKKEQLSAALNQLDLLIKENSLPIDC